MHPQTKYTEAEEGIIMTDYGYYSKKLNKPFDTLDELKKAEGALEEKEKQVERAKIERATAAKEIEELIKQRDELQKKIDEKLNAFVKKYGSYHYTFKNPFNNGVFDYFFKLF